MYKQIRLVTIGILYTINVIGCNSIPIKHNLIDRGTYMVETSHLSQSIDERIRFLFLHYTAEDFHASLKTLTNQHVSAHYLVPANPSKNNGKYVVWQLVPEHQRAWHAGASSWRGRTNLNDTSIGIEIENKGYIESILGRMWLPYNIKQTNLVIALSKDIVQRYAILPQNVVGHMDIAPHRKLDPGPLFPWKQLAEQGIGAWPDQKTVDKYLAMRSKDQPTDLFTLQNKLASYGYDIIPNGINNTASHNVIAAFQMHFRPANFRGLPDAETEAIVDALLEKYGSIP
ncbi:N-acetylmuramoyl-L-alanine amidase AmiD [Candidatus Profftia lariciata]|uniref:N-acetylmuramoyl-L-alanine amidase n=1 Tax=Candidatus Profftia lariciata TaxID=1987921 RepID=UPI001D015ACA|nr:N-acetylmuramoyl-L-alanine amidase [Candidatus Profftia lariciata]UDG81674.1 N-acetylmuramoyl-L-alanine amidase AmiD [Candidatus Profftia lariciata]